MMIMMKPMLQHQKTRMSSMMKIVVANNRCVITRQYCCSRIIVNNRQSIFNGTTQQKSTLSYFQDIFINPQQQQHQQQQQISYRQFSVTTPDSSSSTGLFSIDELQVPEDFHRLSLRAIKDGNRLRNEVSQLLLSIQKQFPEHNDGTPTSTSTTNEISDSVLQDVTVLLHMLDGISQCVCNIIDAAELCRNVHTSDVWRQAAMNCFSFLSDYISQLNVDMTLYEGSKIATTILEQYYTSNKLKMNNTELRTIQEEIRFATMLKNEFERDGIHLNTNDTTKRTLGQDLQNQLVQLESTFQQNIVHSNIPFIVTNTDAVYDVIDKSAFQSSLMNDSNTVELGNNDSNVLQALIKYSNNTNLRKEIYMEYMTSIKENIIVLDDIRTIRNDLAVLYGYESFVDRTVQDKMTKTRTNVQNFLQNEIIQNKPQYTYDMNTIIQLKQYFEKDTTSASTKIEPWDITYYINIAKSIQLQESIKQNSKLYEILNDDNDGSSAAMDLNTILPEYFTVSNTIHSIRLLVKALFNITMIEQTYNMSAVEQWDIDKTSKSVLSTIRKFEFVASEDEPSIGTLYLDLYPRHGKFGHAAHFTVRCGCVSNTDPTEIKMNSTTTTTTQQQQYQHPIVALVCNFTGQGSYYGDLIDEDVFLSHSDVVTLFHEFGHALHSLLSRTKFQHLSGTRGVLDFVETPSNLMENFAWDKVFLQKVLAKHYMTGETLSDPVIELLQQQQRYSFASIEKQNQLLYSLFDQSIFHIPNKAESTIQIWQKYHEQLNIPYAPTTHWYTRFGHLINYGASYYGYLYAQVFSKKIWDEHFNSATPLSDDSSTTTTTHDENIVNRYPRPLTRQSGELLWKKVLIYGGAKDPNEMLSDILKKH